MADIQFDTFLTVEVFPERIAKVTDSPEGPVGLAVRNKAEQLLANAIPRIGTRYSGTTGKVTDGRSGRMKDSGKVVSIGGASYSVRFDHPAAAIHHGGASPHVYSENQWYINQHISTRHDTPFRRHGFIPFLHPGNKGNPYLTDAARAVGLKPSGSLLRGTRPARIFRLRPV